MKTTDVKSKLLPHLRKGEEVRWAGVPDPKVTFSPADAYLIPFSLMWGGFAIFWEVGVLTSGAPLFFALFGVVFVLIGLYFIFGRFIAKRRRKLKTVYGLTDSRAIVLIDERSVRDTPVQDVSVRTDRSRDNRHVTVLFGDSRYTAHQNTGMQFMGIGHDQGVGFFDVAQPDALVRALDEVRSGEQRD